MARTDKSFPFAIELDGALYMGRATYYPGCMGTLESPPEDPEADLHELYIVGGYAALDVEDEETYRAVEQAVCEMVAERRAAAEAAYYARC